MRGKEKLDEKQKKMVCLQKAIPIENAGVKYGKSREVKLRKRLASSVDGGT